MYAGQGSVAALLDASRNVQPSPPVLDTRVGHTWVRARGGALGPSDCNLCDAPPMLPPMLIKVISLRNRTYPAAFVLAAQLAVSVFALQGAAGSIASAGSSDAMRLIDLSTSAQTTLAGAVGKDQLGNDLRAGDIDGDGIDDLLMGAHWGSVGGRNIVGRAYALRGREVWPETIDFANRLAADWWVMGVGSEARMGSAIAAGDISGDGIDDFVIGSLLANPFESSLSSNVGGVYAILGAEDGGGRWDLLNTEPNIVIGGGTSPGGADQLGTDLVLGDVNGDGYADLFGAAMNRDGRKGGVLGWWGPLTDGTRIDSVEDPPDILIEGVVPNGYVGATVAIGDLNTDGIEDLIIGALNLGEVTPESNGGLVVFFGGEEFPRRHDLAVEPAPLTIIGRPTSVMAAAFSAGRCACRGRPIVVSDLTGDGINDLAIGAIHGADRNGSVHVLAGPFGPGMISLSTTEHFEIRGPARDSRFGWSIEAGDLDGDGKDELVVAAPFVDVPDRIKAGQVFGLRGPLPVTGTLNASTGAALRIDGRSEGDGDAGITLVLADTNGDGIDDLHIGFPDGNPGGKLSVGEVHRLAGPLLDLLPTPTVEATSTPTLTPTSPTPASTSEPSPTWTPIATETMDATATTEPSPIPSVEPPDPTPSIPPIGMGRVFFPVLLRRY